MMGRQTGDQSQLFYLFNLERRIPAGHLLRRINPIVTAVLADLHENLAPLRRQRACLLPFDLHETGKCIERRGTSWRDRINRELITRRVNGKCRRSLGHAIENARFSVGRRLDTAVSRFIAP